MGNTHPTLLKQLQIPALTILHSETRLPSEDCRCFASCYFERIYPPTQNLSGAQDILRGTSFNPSPIWAQSSQNSGTHSCRKKTQNFEIYPPKPIDIAFTLEKTETPKYDYLDRTHLHQRDVSIYFQCKYSNYSEQIQFIFNANTVYSVYSLFGANSVYIHWILFSAPSLNIQCVEQSAGVVWNGSGADSEQMANSNSPEKGVSAELLLVGNNPSHW